MSRRCRSPLECRYRNAHPLRTLFMLFDDQRKRLVFGLLVGLVKHTPLLFMPVVVGNVINIITDPRRSLNEVWVNAIVIGVLLLQNIPMHTLYIRYISLVIRNVEAALRNALIRRMQELSIAFHNRFESGRLHSKILRDVEAVEVLASQGINTVFFGIVTATFALAVTASRDRLVMLFFLLAIPVSVVLIRLFRNRISTSNKALRWEVELMSARISEMVAMLPITRAHAVERKEIGRMNSQVEQVMNRGIRVDVVNAIFGASSWVTFQSFQFSCLLFTGYLAYRGRIRVGDVVMYQGFFSQIVQVVALIIGVYPQLAKGFESIRSMGEVLECPDVEFNEGKRVVETVRGEISFEHVGFVYEGSDTPAIDDFTCTINPGECVAFVGESGSGKSTLMNLVIGFRRPTRGRILLDGQDMTELDLRTFRRHLAVVPQETILFSGTIRENITYGLDNVSSDRLTEIIESANLAEMIGALPDGLDTFIGEHGARLSGGQRQRIAIARALIRDPRIIIFDEATSALDVASELKVQQAIERLIRGRTTLIVAHRLSTIRKAERIIALRDGHCLETGTPDELIKRKGEYFRLYTLQS